MKNKLLDLNNYLFEQIERINDDTLTDDQLEKTIKKAEVINKTAENIIRNGELALKVVNTAAEFGFVAPTAIPVMLGIEKTTKVITKNENRN